MRATSIRHKDGTKLESHELQQLCETLLAKLGRKGFITDVTVLTSTAIKIGLHMRSFRINTAKIGHNARIGRCTESPKGYKRTDVPTWDQRVEFNDIVNAVFDTYKLKAFIKSGCFTIRTKEGARTEWDWEHETPSWMGYHGEQLFGTGELASKIMTEKDARQELDSDRLEAEHKELTKVKRREQGREYRAKMRKFNASPKVTLAGFSHTSKIDKLSGKRVSHAKFGEILSKLGRYEQKRVKFASIEATVQS